MKKTLDLTLESLEIQEAPSASDVVFGMGAGIIVGIAIGIAMT